MYILLIKIVDWSLKVSGTLNANVKKRSVLTILCSFDFHIGRKEHFHVIALWKVFVEGSLDIVSSFRIKSQKL